MMPINSEKPKSKFKLSRHTTYSCGCEDVRWWWFFGRSYQYKYYLCIDHLRSHFTESFFEAVEAENEVLEPEHLSQIKKSNSYEL